MAETKGNPGAAALFAAFAAAIPNQDYVELCGNMEGLYRLLGEGKSEDPVRDEAAATLALANGYMEKLLEKDFAEPKKRAPAFKFAMAKVPRGATLVWIHDPDITCTAYDERQVQYKQKFYSLSGLAKKLRSTRSECGPDHWLYEGETLQARRRRFEHE